MNGRAWTSCVTLLLGAVLKLGLSPEGAAQQAPMPETLALTSIETSRSSSLPSQFLPQGAMEIEVGGGWIGGWYRRYPSYGFQGLQAYVELQSTILREGETKTVLAWDLARLYERNGDDVVTLLGATAWVRLPVGPGVRWGLGAGLGWLRWVDPQGWDRGVWDRTFRRVALDIGAELPRRGRVLPVLASVWLRLRWSWEIPYFSPTLALSLSLSGVDGSGTVP